MALKKTSLMTDENPDDPSLNLARSKFMEAGSAPATPKADVQGGNLASGLSGAAQVAGRMSGSAGDSGVGGIASGALSGAATGAAFGGGAGAAAGAAVGTIGAIAGNAAAARKAQRDAQQASLMKQSEIFQNTATNENTQIQSIINGLRSAYVR